VFIIEEDSIIMSTVDVQGVEALTMELRLSSGNGPITRTILRTPPRDALPSEIPVIDISGAFSSSVEDRRAVAKEIREAAMNNGFFYISNHGVEEALIEELQDAWRAFFKQDLETKKKADISQSAYFNGYKGPGTQRINRDEGVDVRETFSWTYDPRYDPSVAEDVDAIPPEARQFMRPEEFPWEATAHMPRLKEAVVKYFAECLRMARALTKAFALSLDLDEEFFANKVKYPDAAYAFNYYPSLSSASSSSTAQDQAQAQAGGDVSIGSHTDFQLFTILHQQYDVSGLQVLTRAGQWLNATPIPGTFVVNIADYLQRVTNGRYVSTVHRARNTSGRERLSMAFFWGFGLHESCGVVESCVGEEGVLFEEIGCEEWVQRRAREMMKVVG
jgi:isopenicillin N synthase-like dioxygenase